MVGLKIFLLFQSFPQVIRNEILTYHFHGYGNHKITRTGGSHYYVKLERDDI